MRDVDWDDVRRWRDAVDAAEPIIQEVLEADRLRWNNLLYSLCDVLGKVYEGETSEELVEMLHRAISQTKEDGNEG